MIKRLDNELLEEIRKEAIREYQGIKCVTPPSNSTRAAISTAASNLVIAEQIIRLVDTQRTIGEDYHTVVQELEKCTQNYKNNFHPSFMGDVLFPDESLTAKIIETLDLAEKLIKRESWTQEDCIAFGTLSQEIRNKLANREKARKG